MTRSHLFKSLLCVFCVVGISRVGKHQCVCASGHFSKAISMRDEFHQAASGFRIVLARRVFFARARASERLFHIARNGNALLLCVITLRGAHKKRGAEMNLFLPQSAPCDKKGRKAQRNSITLIIINSVLSSQHTPTFCSAADYIFLLGD
jgi:hypothetical protein